MACGPRSANPTEPRLGQLLGRRPPCSGWRDVDRLDRQISGDEGGQVLTKMMGHRRHVARRQLLNRPPTRTLKRCRFQCLEPLGLVLPALTPGDMDAVVGFEVIASEGVLGLLGPHTGTHLDVRDTGFLLELTQRRCSRVFFPPDATSGDLQPVRLVGVDRVLGRDEKDPSLTVEKYDPGCRPS